MEVIKGGLTEKQEKLKEIKEFKYLKYKTLYYEYLYGYEGTPDPKKAVFYGVKYVAKTNIDEFELDDQFILFMCDIQDIIQVMRTMTVNELVNMFPILKEYDGERYECKDYFSTMQFLETLDWNKPIGQEIHEFLSSYYNNDIINFCVKELLLMDKINKREGRKGIMEQFLEMADPQGKIDVITVHRDEGYIYHKNTGKTEKIRKPRKRKPSYMSVVN